MFLDFVTDFPRTEIMFSKSPHDFLRKGIILSSVQHNIHKKKATQQFHGFSFLILSRILGRVRSSTRDLPV